jgi:hypothetical protein
MVPLMPISFVLRLVPSALAESKIVGQVREVETGETAQIRSADDLLSFLFVHNGGHVNGPGPKPEVG